MMKDHGINPGLTKSDRRGSDRYECNLKVVYRDSDKWLTGTASDISEEGIRINTSQPFEQGRKITIIFENFKNMKSKIMYGSVAWRNNQSLMGDPNLQSPSMGVRFDGEFPLPSNAVLRPN